MAVTATIFELHVLLPKEIFDMLMFTEHWRHSILNLVHFAHDEKVNKDKCRKSTIKFKRQRIQKDLSKYAQTARKEAKKGTNRGCPESRRKHKQQLE